MDKNTILNAFRGRIGFRTDGVLTLDTVLTDSQSGLYVNDIPGLDVPHIVVTLCEKNRSGRNITAQDFLSQHYDNAVLSLINDFINVNGSLVTPDCDFETEIIASPGMFDQALRHKLAIAILEEAIHTKYVNEAFEEAKEGWMQMVVSLEKDLFGYEYKYHDRTRTKPGWLSNIATTLKSQCLNYTGPIFFALGGEDETEENGSDTATSETLPPSP